MPLLPERKQNGVVVQLVRIPACHAGGRGFESRPYRRGERRMSNIKNIMFLNYSFFFYISVYIRVNMHMRSAGEPIGSSQFGCSECED